jgi:hypothetical protein
MNKYIAFTREKSFNIDKQTYDQLIALTNSKEKVFIQGNEFWRNEVSLRLESNNITQFEPQQVDKTDVETTLDCLATVKLFALSGAKPKYFGRHQTSDISDFITWLSRRGKTFRNMSHDVNGVRHPRETILSNCEKAYSIYLTEKNI